MAEARDVGLEIVYARRRRCCRRPGASGARRPMAPMNVGQAIGGFKLFTGVDADAARMDAHFRRLVS